MREALLEKFHDLPPAVAIPLIAMLPVFELRGAIPYAYSPLAGNYGSAQPLLTYLLAVAGNFVPVLPILTLLGPVERRFRGIPRADRFLDWLFARTRKRSAVIQRYQALGLILFVAIPAPMTGAWTGAVAAYLFKLPLRFAVPCIIIGICLAGVIVTLASMGALHLWS
ncbi:MAG TPA: small multi-drug export protein [Candidatus Krumholzibacteria bacterium]|nr:small multi-drug export protein [Candidatus Krumholzibacteria bacterium]HRX50745.1 small multi-drug export protein [Candidatus Krumholzibacteria bacterium]